MLDGDHACWQARCCFLRIDAYRFARRTVIIVPGLSQVNLSASFRNRSSLIEWHDLWNYLQSTVYRDDAMSGSNLFSQLVTVQILSMAHFRRCWIRCARFSNAASSTLRRMRYLHDEILHRQMFLRVNIVQLTKQRYHVWMLVEIAVKFCELFIIIAI